MMKLIREKIRFELRELLRSLPKVKFLYILAQKYVDDYWGEHNSNMFTNGELRFLRQNIANFNTVFDVGANVGEWTKFALSQKNNLNIHCFEPNSFAFQKLLRNNFPSNVICNNFGLSSSKREARLFILEDGSPLNSLYERYRFKTIDGLESQKKEIVNLDTLDNYCIRNNINNIDFVKIDVEGHEFDVLKGMKNSLGKKQIKIVQFEYGGCFLDACILLRNIFDFFEKYDYKFYQIFPGRVKPIESYSSRLDNFQYKNFLIIQNNYNFSS